MFDKYPTILNLFPIDGPLCFLRNAVAQAPSGETIMSYAQRQALLDAGICMHSISIHSQPHLFDIFRSNKIPCTPTNILSQIVYHGDDELLRARFEAGDRFHILSSKCRRHYCSRLPDIYDPRSTPHIISPVVKPSPGIPAQVHPPLPLFRSVGDNFAIIMAHSNNADAYERGAPPFWGLSTFFSGASTLRKERWQEWKLERMANVAAGSPYSTTGADLAAYMADWFNRSEKSPKLLSNVFPSTAESIIFTMLMGLPVDAPAFSSIEVVSFIRDRYPLPDQGAYEILHLLGALPEDMCTGDVLRLLFPESSPTITPTVYYNRNPEGETGMFP